MLPRPVVHALSMPSHRPKPSNVREEPKRRIRNTQLNIQPLPVERHAEVLNAEDMRGAKVVSGSIGRKWRVGVPRVV